MAEDDGAEKKHAPDAEGWRKAAEGGQIPRSQDLHGVLAMVAGAAVILGSPELLLGPIRGVVTSFLGHTEARPEHLLESILGWLGTGGQAVAMAVAAPLLAVATVSSAIQLAETQGQTSTKLFEPDFSKLDPISGFQNHFMSSQPLVELAKGLLKLGILGVAFWWALADEMRDLPAAATRPAGQQLQILIDLAWRLIKTVAAPLLALACADWAWAWWKMYQQLMKTDQQVKQEGKEQDGDPQMKAQRRARARKWFYTSTIAQVAQADVVITNPTHFAVALRYRRGQDQAPIVVAKGIDHLALKIRAEARKQGIPQIENRPLARGLYAAVQMGGAIPEAFFKPVALVLAEVYKRRPPKMAMATPPRARKSA